MSCLYRISIRDKNGKINNKKRKLGYQKNSLICAERLIFPSSMLEKSKIKSIIALNGDCFLP